MCPPAANDAWERANHDQRRRLIVDVAMRLLHDRGLAAVTMRTVAGELAVGTMTLYTYISGQDELRREMTRRGFEQLRAGCQSSSTLGTPLKWRGGAKRYLHFAIDNPNLYKLMFDTPLSGDAADDQMLWAGFETLLQRVREELAAAGTKPQDLDAESRRAAGRYWIALHGMAMLAIADRLRLLPDSVDNLLDDLLARVSPT